MSNNDLWHQTYFLVPSYMLGSRTKKQKLYWPDWHGIQKWNLFSLYNLNRLMCETVERCLGRSDFRWLSTTKLQVEQNRRVLSAWNFPGYCLALSCGVMLRGFSIGFTFNTNLSIFKVKTRERKLFCCRINRSRALFFFSNHGSCYIKNWAQSPMASRVERLNALLICDICECFCNETVAICCENVLYLREKNLHATLKVWKNIAC